MSGYGKRVVITLATAMALWAWGASAQAQLTVGSIAPDFTLNNWQTGQPTHLRDFAGQIVVLDFFATWCGPCRTASNELERYVQEYYDVRGGNPGHLPVKIISMAIDGSDADIASYMQSYNLKFILDDRASQVFNTYPHGGGIPFFAVINGADNTNYQPWEIIHEQLGYSSGNYSTFRSKIDSVVRTPEPSSLTLLAGVGLVLRMRRPAAR